MVLMKMEFYVVVVTVLLKTAQSLTAIILIILKRIQMDRTDYKNMTSQEYYSFKAELSTLDKLIAETPEGNVIDLMSLKCRRTMVESIIEDYEVWGIK